MNLAPLLSEGAQPKALSQLSPPLKSWLQTNLLNADKFRLKALISS
ncbi:hypothetical protein VCHA54P489_180035 [Vibrio chagasii]|nr:hypothetical protein VCHA34P120_20313 [Vibrio chagasii]CAH6972751.1 hypothetical protein VCHA34P115_40343 [Vibrio chagasii]CAH6976041.1 hypothetical protein VCHA36O157_40338 [Vibrio chagasii]CAH6977659.1 hypothetical protein VCHA36P161_40212 [Vibrio chagasii]CAH7011916.1 hypothetical protein VCHA40O237_10040 [Vibrio chagasii]